ncbi:unnamed protein product [Tetraodon nigroviridis]|uniref:Oxidative stress-responsive serine-rich protein 1 n=1 Tax=Tetraodon nigroviridis TaxID=99883 RepID=Q4T0D0_TETNG|nr:unnamed protein product [Tetraodon nigroviridis]
MEAGGKDGEEETLQSAFKKLRVDAESVPAEPPRSGPRSALDLSGAKPKLGSLKDTWHSCLRKTSRGASRTQRRRRSKSPILHPPKFTYCGAAAPSPLVTAGGSVKQQRLAVPEPSDFQDEDGRGAECRCPPGALGWAGVEVYSFTGLREVISECERSLASHDHAPRTAVAAPAAAAPSSSPRSCSEQARAYIDDITIEDLSGYMEYYLYIPKKMSHMAEMMYT